MVDASEAERALRLPFLTARHSANALICLCQLSGLLTMRAGANSREADRAANPV